MEIEGTGETVLALLAAIATDVTTSLTKTGIPGPIATNFVFNAVAHGLKKAATER